MDENPRNENPVDENPVNPGSVVVAVTDRPEGAAALAWAVERARTLGVRLDAVPLTSDAPSSPVHTSQQVRRSVEDGARRAGVPARLHDPDPDVAEQLIALSGAGADVVVLPVRQRSATMKFLLGSIAQRVIGEAACPVVTVRA
ncbi:universal stress protein [Kineococcus sp. SYSU DK002]|uniref:universal stress protein n=1 Tax=Kineococcus sp. SYSU DK002 TaxID=3383123 RepID=UPI003D7C3A4D